MSNSAVETNEGSKTDGPHPIDPCAIGMCVDMCIGMCIGICIDMCHRHVERHVCRYICIGMCVDMCIGMVHPTALAKLYLDGH